MLSDFEELEPDGRFSRQQGLPGWNQSRLAAARCLVVGAGALGNELLKNLALLGVGALGIVDFDCVEESNLPRCVLFRPSDVGRPKAFVTRERLLELAPELQSVAYGADVLTEVGAGLLEEYDLLLGAVDSVAARWQLNRLARRAGVPWIDAGVDRDCGQVTRYDPAEGACYECGMTGSMWQRILERHSCGVPAEAAAGRPMVAVALPVVSLTAALQAQEAVKLLMGRNVAADAPRLQHSLRDAKTAELLQPGERLSVSLRPHELLRLQGRRRASCLAHAADAMAAQATELHREDTAVALLRSTGGQSVELEWEVVEGFHCVQCGFQDRVLPEWQLRREMLVCAACGGALAAEKTSRVSLGSRLAEHTLRELGVPAKAHLQLLMAGRSGARWYKIL